jgi:hypothetical protein
MEEADMTTLPPAVVDRGAVVDKNMLEDKIEPDTASSLSWPDLLLAHWLDLKSRLQPAWKQIDTDLAGRLLAVIGLLFAVGLFIRYKLRRLSQNQGVPTSGKRRSRRQRRSQSLFPESLPAPLEGASRNTKMDRPVGLGRLAQWKPETDMPLEPAIHKTHAASQYARNAQPPVSAHRDSQAIDSALRTSMQARGFLPSQAPPAVPPTRPATSGQTTKRSAYGQTAFSGKPTNNPSPLPDTGRPQSVSPKTRMKAPPFGEPKPALPANNTDVLDFLRSVADLMEKDGQTHLANGVKRGMSSLK